VRPDAHGEVLDDSREGLLGVGNGQLVASLQLGLEQGTHDLVVHGVDHVLDLHAGRLAQDERDREGLLRTYLMGRRPLGVVELDVDVRPDAT